jgi:hypothetical protein
MNYNNRTYSPKISKNIPNSTIDKYRAALNLPIKTSSYTKNSQPRRSTVRLSDQAARLIALSIRGLLNS